MPQLPFDTTGRPPSTISSTETRMSEAPTPQLAPMASGALARSSNTAGKSPGIMPIIVRPAVSNEHVAT